MIDKLGESHILSSIVYTAAAVDLKIADERQYRFNDSLRLFLLGPVSCVVDQVDPSKV